jgi:hypothetical protein
MAVGASIAAVGCDLAGNRSLQSNQRQSRILWKVKDPVTKDATYDDHHTIHHIPYKKGKVLQLLVDSHGGQTTGCCDRCCSV